MKLIVNEPRCHSCRPHCSTPYLFCRTSCNWQPSPAISSAVRSSVRAHHLLRRLNLQPLLSPKFVIISHSGTDKSGWLPAGLRIFDNHGSIGAACNSMVAIPIITNRSKCVESKVFKERSILRKKLSFWGKKLNVVICSLKLLFVHYRTVIAWMRIRNLKWCTKVKKAQKFRINYELCSSFHEFSILISERNDSEEIQTGFNTNHITVSHINYWIQHAEIIKLISFFYSILKMEIKSFDLIKLDIKYSQIITLYHK